VEEFLKFIGDFVVLGDGGGDLLVEVFPKIPPEAVELGAQGILVLGCFLSKRAEVATGCVTVQKGAELEKLLLFARVHPLGLKGGHGFANEVKSPLTVEFPIGR
jgi:hypothetical protein